MLGRDGIIIVIELIYSREQRAKWACLHAHLAAAARVKYPAALQRCKFVDNTDTFQDLNLRGVIEVF